MSKLDDFEEWLVEERGLGDRTAHTYYKAIKSMLRRKTLLTALRDDNAASTKHLYWAALRQWAEFTDDDDLTAELVSPRVKRLVQKTGNPPVAIEPYTEDEVSTFRKALDCLRGAPGVEPWVWPSISLMLALGLRARVDLCRLTKKSAQEGLRTGRLTIRTKRDKFRTLPAGIVEEELRELIDIPRWTYLYEAIAPKTEHQESLAYRYVMRMLKQIAGLCGIDPAGIRSHRFRHTAAMRLYRASGHDVRLVQQFLGHEDINTTIRYLRLDRTDEMGRILEEMRNGEK